MSSPAPIQITPRSPIGAFTADAFAAHVKSQTSAPAWWLERKRAAYDTFAALPMPKRTDEPWRFSNIATLTVEGFDPQLAVPTGGAVGAPIGPSALKFGDNQRVVALADK